MKGRLVGIAGAVIICAWIFLWYLGSVGLSDLIDRLIEPAPAAPAEFIGAPATELEFGRAPYFEIDLNVVEAVWPADSSLLIDLSGAYLVTNGTQAITMTGPITIMRVSE